MKRPLINSVVPEGLLICCRKDPAINGWAIFKEMVAFQTGWNQHTLISIKIIAQHFSAGSAEQKINKSRRDDRMKNFKTLRKFGCHFTSFACGPRPLRETKCPRLLWLKPMASKISCKMSR